MTLLDLVFEARFDPANGRHRRLLLEEDLPEEWDYSELYVCQKWYQQPAHSRAEVQRFAVLCQEFAEWRAWLRANPKKCAVLERLVDDDPERHDKLVRKWGDEG